MTEITPEELKIYYKVHYQKYVKNKNTERMRKYRKRKKMQILPKSVSNKQKPKT